MMENIQEEKQADVQDFSQRHHLIPTVTSLELPTWLVYLSFLMDCKWELNKQINR